MPDSKSAKLPIALAGFLLPLAVSHFARGALGKGYEKVTRKPPPKNPAHPDVPWKEAAGWAVVAGVTGGLAKLVSLRLLAPTPIPVEGDGDVDPGETIEVDLD